MKWVFLLCGVLSGSYLQANADTFSKDRMEAFYQVFLSEERAILEASGDVDPSPTPVPVPPPNPPAPPFITGYLPFVLVNNSTLPDSSVNVVVTGDRPADHSIFVFVQFDPEGKGSLVNMTTGMNSNTYSQTLDQFPLTAEGTRVMYVPYIDSARTWISMNEPLGMPVIAGNKLQEPNFTTSSCTVNFDKYEFAYLPQTTPPAQPITQISVNATAVDFFSIPLYLYVSGATSTNSNTGLYQPRSYCMNAAARVFGSVPTQEIWNGLFLRSGGSILRLLSTGKAMTASPSLFDNSYWDATSGYNFIGNIWTDAGSYYQRHPLMIQIPVGSNPTYRGTVDPSTNIFNFANILDNTDTITFQAPPVPPATYPATFFSVSGQILSAEPLWTTETVAGTGVQVSKMFEEAIVAGLVPTTNTLSNSYLTAHTSSYYTINPNLTEEGQSSGPWYDVYSKAIHSLGSIYSFGFDEPLWPDVAVSVENYTSTTYVGVTIGSIN